MLEYRSSPLSFTSHALGSVPHSIWLVYRKSMELQDRAVGLSGVVAWDNSNSSGSQAQSPHLPQGRCKLHTGPGLPDPSL